MSEVELRISELREAGERFFQARSRIDVSVQTVQHIIDQLLALGFDEAAGPEFVLRCNQLHALRDKCSDQLTRFATRLTEAADAVEEALLRQDEEPPVTARRSTGYPSQPGGLHARRYMLPALLADEPEKPLLPLSWDTYVSKTNRPLYDELIRDQQALHTGSDRLTELVQTREALSQDLFALRNRLTSFNNNVDLSTIPRVQSLEAEIIDLDQQILSLKNQITTLRGDILDLTARLDRVRPGMGADLELIANLDGSQTSDWIKSHTYDCVQHIVERMPIPGGIPRHAYLWDQAAINLPQYGITSGDVPLVGSVIVLEREHSYSDVVFGHLMYVERVENGQVWITDNNYPDTPVLLSDLTDELTGPNIQYLYFPWHTQA